LGELYINDFKRNPKFDQVLFITFFWYCFLLYCFDR